eukprot:TRINITY_DN21669_c0_g1_i2.p1 TRINITY_DN21669_c0_g1~~TRINITY_DN21669_c0_g1_i2.p1  ORF type:complete len:448 (+),score=133.69 TRINITY_DN21669_c0_g1_i2:77-1420(+)
MGAGDDSPRQPDRKLVSEDTLLVRICSWNVGEADARTTGRCMLEKWLLGIGDDMPTSEKHNKRPQWAERRLDQPDLVCVGLQEVDMSTPAALKGCCLMGTPNGRGWRDKLVGVLDDRREGSRYELLQELQLVGMQIFLFVSATAKRHLVDSSWVTASTTAGLCGGRCGNKGATVTRVVFRGTNRSVCFVNSHLAAKAAQIERRNQDQRKIQEVTRLSGPGCSAGAVLEHDFIFWFGDLNYRLDMPPTETMGKSRHDVKMELQRLALKSDADPPTLLDKYDQLTQVMGRGDAFTGFTEPRVDWGPTYKVLKGLGAYDMARQPSYTDRILFRAKDDGPPAAGGRPAAAGPAQAASPTLMDSDEQVLLDPLPAAGNLARSAPAPLLQRYAPKGQKQQQKVTGPSRAITCLEYTALSECEGSDHRPIVALFAVQGVLPAVSRAPPVSDDPE